ncbi:unnamed protein product [Schistosoma margrebowiei]|uniref:Uncharacterized protein n=1 Tax=Schistosoma margrebowiei TaxID=48269 RepID=A0A183LVD2_9TREM|nr:unnamed protein product [Schistosoma margrebowiei]
MEAGDQQLVHMLFVPVGYYCPCGALVWNEGFPIPLGGLSVSTNLAKPSVIRFSSSQFRKQHPRHEKANEWNLVVSLITQGNRMVYMRHFPMHKSRLNEIFINLLHYSPMDGHIDLMVAYESDQIKPNNDHSHDNNNDDCIQGPTIRFEL